MKSPVVVSNPLAKAYYRLRWRSAHPLDRQCAHELATHQWLSSQEVQDLQWRKLEILLAHAYEHVPFYRQTFDEHGLRPDDVQSPADYLRIPLLTKKDIQENFARLVADNINQDELIENHTGGSTGQPLRFYQDRRYQRCSSAGRAWGFRMCGFQPGDRQAFLWGSDYDSREHKGWKSRLRDCFKNVLWINVFDLTEQSLAETAQLLSMWKPDFIWGYTSSVEMLAKVVRKRGIRTIRPRAVQLTAEVVTPAQRAYVEETFQCRVFNRYGCREVSLIAHECSAHSGLHILADNNYVEFLRNGHPVSAGQEGQIVITNLNNYAMPLLRYQIADTGIPSDAMCECRRGYPLMDMAKGRLVDIIVSPSGKLLHGEFFTHLFYKVEGVRQFQVVQETQRDLVVKVVPGDGFGQETLRFLEQAMHDHGDPDFVVHFEMCDRIPLTPSGKYRFTMSRISAP